MEELVPGESRRAKIGMTEEARLARLGRIGGSDARIIMSGDQSAIEHLWRVKRREIEDDNYDDVLLVQLGNATEDLNATWFEKQTGYFVTDEQRVAIDPDWPIASCTLDGIVRETLDGPPLGVFEAKFMLPFGWSMNDAVKKYGPQVQHNMRVTGSERGWLSVITGAGQWQKAEMPYDEFYGIALRDEEEDFWDCVKTGRTPGIPALPIPRVTRIHSVSMGDSFAWAGLAKALKETMPAAERYDRARRGLKRLFPVDAVAAEGHGVKINLSKDGKVLITVDGSRQAKKDARQELAKYIEPEPDAAADAA
jgi:hypothetical protein